MWNPSCDSKGMAVHDAEQNLFQCGNLQGICKKTQQPHKVVAGEASLDLFLINSAGSVLCNKPIAGAVWGRVVLQTQVSAWIIPWKQMTRPWHFSSPALLLPTLWNDHKNLFFPRLCFSPGEFLRVCQILGPFSQSPDLRFSLTSPWESWKNEVPKWDGPDPAYSRLALCPHKGFLALLRFSLNVLYCSGLPEYFCNPAEALESGWAWQSWFWAQALLLISSFCLIAQNIL